MCVAGASCTAIVVNSSPGIAIGTTQNSSNLTTHKSNNRIRTTAIWDRIAVATSTLAAIYIGGGDP
jgi:hypothetical protein